MTICATLTAREVRTLPDFPAEIKAPAGTVAGVSGFQLAMAHAIFTVGKSPDVLAALNSAALKNSLQHLNQSGLHRYQDKDWQKAGMDKSFLDNYAEHYHIVSFPLISQTLQAVAEYELTKPQATKTKNFYALGLLAFIAKKFKP